MAARSAFAPSRAWMFSRASDTPMLRTMRSNLGTWKGFSHSKRFIMAGITCF